MKITEERYRYRNDLGVRYQCEHCGAERDGWAYDDAFFFDQVLPQKLCGECGRASAAEYVGLE